MSVNQRLGKSILFFFVISLILVTAFFTPTCMYSVVVNAASTQPTYKLTPSGGDDTKNINDTIATAATNNPDVGGIIEFTSGTYNSGTINLKSYITLKFDKGATLKAKSGKISAPESALNDKQDYGHSVFKDALIYGNELTNIKIIGEGTIDGNGALVTGLNSASTSGQGDKAIALRKCTNVEIGGDTTTKLTVGQGGHFAVLATGCNTLNIHDFHVPSASSGQRDIFDIMECNDVTVERIYSEWSEDDVVKLGSDCALGSPQSMNNVTVDTVEAFTWCNVFQIGSETAGPISNVHVSNLTVNGAGKAGFGISCNDGSVITNVTLDGTNTFKYTVTPIFINISGRMRTTDSSAKIGSISDVTLNNITATDCYGSSKNNKPNAEYTATIAGYKNSSGTYYVSNVTLNNISLKVKGGHSSSDCSKNPPELPVGDYNSTDFGTRPSFGWWVRHVKGISFNNCKVSYDSNDNRYDIVIDNDPSGATLNGCTLAKGSGNNYTIELLNTVDQFDMKNCSPLPDVDPAKNFSSATYF